MPHGLLCEVSIFDTLSARLMYEASATLPQLKVYGGSPHVEKKLAELLSHRCCVTFNSDDPACALVVQSHVGKLTDAYFVLTTGLQRHSGRIIIQALCAPYEHPCSRALVVAEHPRCPQTSGAT